MPLQIIKDGKVQENDWTVLTGEEQELDQARYLVPLSLWGEHSDRVKAQSSIGMLLPSDTDPADIAKELDNVSLVAIDFPAFTDGRGYSIARLLRERYGYEGELRAVGDIMQDQLYYLARCGFDSFQIKEGKNAEAALAGLNDFSTSYQAATDCAEPLFRRR